MKNSQAELDAPEWVSLESLTNVPKGEEEMDQSEGIRGRTIGRGRKDSKEKATDTWNANAKYQRYM
jgi:hypothetical protein